MHKYYFISVGVACNADSKRDMEGKEHCQTWWLDGHNFAVIFLGVGNLLC